MMNKLINEINTELNLNISIKNIEDLKESFLNIEKDLTIGVVKKLNNDYFPVFSQMNSESIENDIYMEVKDFFLKCNGLYTEWTSAKDLFENKTLRVLDEKKSIGLNFMSDDELERINEVFYEENQNIYESIEFLSKNDLIESLMRKYNRKLLKENIQVLFQ